MPSKKNKQTDVGLWSFDDLEKAVVSHDHKWFSRGDYNLNLVGVRTKQNDANTFNDHFFVAFLTLGCKHVFRFACTTDPGVYYRNHPANIKGTAIVKPGQYHGMWALGMHQGKYTALVQVGPITVYRDNNRDHHLDTNVIEETGFFGINCHRAGQKSESHQVDKWSAGCQVLANPLDYALLISLARLANARYPNRFTYTLLEA